MDSTRDLRVDALVELIYDKPKWYGFSPEIREMLAPAVRCFAIDEVIAYIATLVESGCTCLFIAGLIPCKPAQLFDHHPGVRGAIIMGAELLIKIRIKLLEMIKDNLAIFPDGNTECNTADVTDKSIGILRSLPAWREIERTLATIVVM